MVKPDGVHQRLTGAVLAFLGDRGLTALATKDLLLTPDLRARLYATTRSGGRLDWDLNAVLYTLGPVTAVLLRGPGGAAAHLSGELKGHFLPTRARPGTIRGSFNAMNPIFNLVHASDNEEEVAREAPVLFGCAVGEALRDSTPLPRSLSGDSRVAVTHTGRDRGNRPGGTARTAGSIRPFRRTEDER
jgi:nucleoside diphosphate kinase